MLHENGRLGAVHHVVGERLAAERAVVALGQLGIQTARGCVDDDVVSTRLNGCDTAARQSATDSACRLAEQIDQFVRLRSGPVDDRQRVWGALQHGKHDAARGTARAQQQNSRALERRGQIDFDVAHEAEAVRIVTMDLSGLEAQGVHRARGRRTRRQLRGQRVCLQLERHGDVQTTATRVDERANLWHEGVDGCEQMGVLDPLTSLLGKARMNKRRFAMADRIADHRIAVTRVGGRSCRVSALRSRMRTGLDGLAHCPGSATC